MHRKRVSGSVLPWLAGVGPLLFLAIATVAGSLRTDYDPVADPISALAIGPGAWIQHLNFALLAASFVAFAAVLKHRLGGGSAGLGAPAIFGMMAAGVTLAGIFPMDPVGASATLSGRLHGIAGFFVFPWIPIVLLVAARRFRRDRQLRSYFAYTVATALFSIAVLVFFFSFVGTPDMPPRIFSGVRGLAQRLLLLPFFVWIALVVRRAYRDQDETNASPYQGAASAVPFQP